MIDFLAQYRLEGLFIGLSTFVIIGVFHPLVIKGEYYFGEKVKWAFLLMGIIFLIASLSVGSIIASALMGVTSFSSFWSILEVKQQVERVRKGWFPANPNREAKRKAKIAGAGIDNMKANSRKEYDKNNS